jgi:hypothetical protein
MTKGNKILLNEIKFDITVLFNKKEMTEEEKDIYQRILQKIDKIASGGK